MLSLLQATLDSMGKEDFPEDMEKYYDLSVEAVDLTRRLLSAILNSGAGNRVLAEGRVVVINTAVYRNCLAVILRPVGGSGSKSDAARAVNMQAESDKRFHMLILCEPKPASPATAKANKADEKRGGGGPAASELPLPLTHIFKPQGQFGWAVTEVLGVEILCITPERISVVAKEIMGSRNTTAQSAAAQQLLRVAQKYDTRPPMLDPINDMNLRDLDVVEMHSRVESIVDALQRMTCTQHPDFVALYGRMHERKRLYQQVSANNTKCEALA